MQGRIVISHDVARSLGQSMNGYPSAVLRVDARRIHFEVSTDRDIEESPPLSRLWKGRQELDASAVGKIQIGLGDNFGGSRTEQEDLARVEGRGIRGSGQVNTIGGDCRGYLWNRHIDLNWLTQHDIRGRHGFARFRLPQLTGDRVMDQGYHFGHLDRFRAEVGSIARNLYFRTCPTGFDRDWFRNRTLREEDV